MDQRPREESVSFTKKVAKHDRIEIDGTDYSNAFRQFGFSSEHSAEDVSGFSVSGNDETTYYAECTINQFGPADTRGQVSVMPFSATPATEDGIQSGAGT